jgi:hypothetical protein
MSMVCAWCDVYARVECNATDENGIIISSWCVCAYCGRSELRFNKLGHQTPLPKDVEETARGGIRATQQKETER